MVEWDEHITCVMNLMNMIWLLDGEHVDDDACCHEWGEMMYVMWCMLGWDNMLGVIELECVCVCLIRVAF